MAKITAAYGPLCEALRAIGIDTDNARRVVIDIQAGEVPVIHVELIDTENLISVIRTLGGVEITRKDG